MALVTPASDDRSLRAGIAEAVKAEKVHRPSEPEPPGSRIGPYWLELADLVLFVIPTERERDWEAIGVFRSLSAMVAAQIINAGVARRTRTPAHKPRFARS